MAEQDDRSPYSGDEETIDDAQTGASKPNGAANNRACDYCHRMKMKCIGKENPPCNRCRQSNHQCTFDGPRKSKSSKVEDRLRLVEVQIGSMQGNLEELLRLQRGAVAAQVPPQIFSPVQHLSAHMAQPPPPPQTAQPQQLSAITQWVAEPSSGSEDGPDPFDVDHVAAPWGNMLSLAEAARLKADPHVVGDDASLRGKRGSPYGQSSDPRARKKARAAGVECAPELPLTERGTHLFPDPVDLGWCTLERGKQLFDIFFDGCAVYMPCFDPERDTWESLRRRSPFAITVILAVAVKCEDGPGPASELQTKLREHAERIGMSTLFTPVSRIEIVQSMILLASWGETFWRPGGHAVRIGMDLGLHKCLAFLAEGKMGAGKTPDELEAERPVVAGARTWLTLFKLEYEMSFAYGRPGLFTGEATIKDGRQFLQHPLSLPTDARLVSSCECLAWRMPLHQPFALAPSNATQPFPGMDEKLRQVNRLLVEWYDHWDSYYGIPKDHFLRETLVTGHAGSFLWSNSYLLHGVRNRRDVTLLSDERRQWLQEAGRMAHRLVDMCLNGQQYTKNFRFANLLTHYNIAYAARFLIRMSTLVPEAVNLRQIGRDVEGVAKRLAQVPGFQFAHFLRDVIKRARQERVLPPPSRAPSRLSSPTKQPIPLAPMSDPATSWATNFSPIPMIGNPVQIPEVAFNLESISPSGVSSHLDFGYAEHLFSNTGPVGTSGPGFVSDPSTNMLSGIADQGYSLDAWFPFPPLENDSSPLASLGGGGPTQYPSTDTNPRQTWW